MPVQNEVYVAKYAAGVWKTINYFTPNVQDMVYTGRCLRLRGVSVEIKKVKTQEITLKKNAEILLQRGRTEYMLPSV